MITLYHSPLACSLACRLALAEGGVEHRVVAVRTALGEQRDPNYAARNPLCKVPLLEADGLALTETPAILQYIASIARHRIVSADPVRFAQTVSILAYLSSSVHPAWTAIMHPDRFTTGEGAGVAQSAVARLAAALTYLEARAQTGQFDGPFDIAQAYLAIFLLWRGHAGALPLPDVPTLDAVQQRVLTRPLIAEILAEDLQAFGTMRALVAAASGS